MVENQIVTDTSYEREHLAELTMENTTGIQGTAYASCVISGEAGNVYNQQPPLLGTVDSQNTMNITDITSAKVPVFTCDKDIDRSAGYHFQNVIEIDGIDADETMSQINGRQFFIYPGSGGLVTGTSKISLLVPVDTTGATITGNTSGLELLPKFNAFGGGRGATITASCSATTLTIVSIDAAGSNYSTGLHTVTLGGETWSININSSPDGVILNTKNHPAERRKFRVSTVYEKRKQPSVHLNQFSVSLNEVDTFDTSDFDAISSSSDCTMTQVNPVSFELVISGTFDSETSTIPASLYNCGRYS